MKTTPNHYSGDIILRFIEAYQISFNLGNVIKYVLRAGKKDGETPLDDLNKALFYAGRPALFNGSLVVADENLFHEIIAAYPRRELFIRMVVIGIAIQSSKPWPDCSCDISQLILSYIKTLIDNETT